MFNLQIIDDSPGGSIEAYFALADAAVYLLDTRTPNFATSTTAAAPAASVFRGRKPVLWSLPKLHAAK